jgi:hypothetical protein
MMGDEFDRPAGEEEREERVKRLILSAVSRCGACRRRYQLENLAVVGHREHLWMVTVICERCHTQGFITAVIEGHDLGVQDSDGGPLAAEQASEAVADPVTTDDLLDIHQFLDEFDGNFVTLFARNQSGG